MLPFANQAIFHIVFVKVSSFFFTWLKSFVSCHPATPKVALSSLLDAKGPY